MGYQMGGTMNIQSIMDEINKVRQKQLITVQILELIEPVMRTFEGKKITKRIETAVKKVLPAGYVTSYCFQYSWFSLKIWGNELKYDDKIDLTIGYDTDFKMERYLYHNQRYYLDKGRFEELGKWTPQMVMDLVQKKEEVEEVIKNYKTFTKDLPWPVSQYFRID